MEVLYLLTIAIAILFLLLLPPLLKPISKTNLPPGPRPWPILGNLLQLGKLPHVTLANMARAYGPLISLKLGTQLHIVASSPATAAQVLKTNDRVLSARYIPQAYRVESYIAHSLAFSFDCNEQWKSFRTLCKNHLFTTKMLDLQAHMREKKVGEMMGSMRKGQVVRIGEFVYSTLFNIMGNIIFSRDVLVLDDDGLKNYVSRMLEVGSASNLADFYPSLAWMDVQGLNRKAEAVKERVFEILEGFIVERKREMDDCNSKQDFLNALLSAGCSDLQIKGLISDMFVGGADSTVTLFEWIMSELMRNPKVMRKVRDELERVVGARREDEYAVRESHLSHLYYLEACIKESLRLHPPGPLLLPRQALESCEVLSYTIPKDCRVLVNVWAIGRDPEIWKDPLTFSPERFLLLDSSTVDLDYKGNDFELAPFGAGRRICPGVPMASRVLKLILASLIHSFEWSLPHGMQPSEVDMGEKYGITLKREQPLLLIPT